MKKLSFKILSFSILEVVLFIIGTVLTLNAIKLYANKQTEVVTNYDLQLELSDLDKQIQTLQKTALYYISNMDTKKDTSAYDECAAQISSQLEQYKTDLDEKTYEEMNFHVLAEDFNQLNTELDKAIHLCDANNQFQSLAVMNSNVAEYGAKIETDVKNMIEQQREEVSKTNSSIVQAQKDCNITMYLVLILLCVLFLISLFVVIQKIINPVKSAIHQLKRIRVEFANERGNLTDRIQIRTKDEIGQLVDGINDMLAELQNIITAIDFDSNKLENTVNITKEKIQTADSSAMDISSTMQELSASTQEISSNVELIHSNANEIDTDLSHISSQTNDVVDYTVAMKTRASGMETLIQENVQNTKKKLDEIIERVQKAFESSKNVEAINTMTSDILEISNQTNLLSLNASIEASRAGDAGLGFAVVAEQIRNLADSSRKTATSIQEINETVNAAIQDIVHSADNLIEYIQKDVLEQYQKFMENSKQYNEDSEYIYQGMLMLQERSLNVDEQMTKIVQSLEEITRVTEEEHNGVNGVAISTTALVDCVKEINESMDQNIEVMNALRAQTSRFQM